MNRKINLVGKNTLTVSIPSEWAKRQGIKKGDDVQIEEKGSVLEISSQNRRPGKQVSLAIDRMDRSTLVSCLRHYYRFGADTIALHFKNPQGYSARLRKTVPLISMVTDEASRLMGMEMTEQRENEYIIRCVIDEGKVDFDTFFRKIFFLVMHAFKTLSDCAENRNRAAEIRQDHNSITRCVNYCIRSLHKFNSHDPNKTAVLVSILESLEFIVDIMDNASKRIDAEARLTCNFSSEVEKMRALFEEFTSLHYAFSMKKVEAINTARIDIEAGISKNKKFTADETAILNQISAILIGIRNMVGLTVVLREK